MKVRIERIVLAVDRMESMVGFYSASAVRAVSGSPESSAGSCSRLRADSSAIVVTSMGRTSSTRWQRRSVGQVMGERAESASRLPSGSSKKVIHSARSGSPNVPA